MKRILSISLATLLLMSTIGVTVHKHYCDSILVATSILPHVGDACDAEMPMDDDSCADDNQRYDVDSPLTLLSLNFELAPSFETLTFIKITVADTFTEDILTPKFNADLYPPPSEPNIYTRVQSFLL